MYFPDHMIDLIHIWYEIDMFQSFIQQYPSPLPQGQGQVKVMDLDIFNVKVFNSSHFPNYAIDFVYI